MKAVATLGEVKANGEGLMANCRGSNCGHGKPLDLDMLIDWLGADYCIINETRISAACRCEVCNHKGAAIHRIANTAPREYQSDRSD